MCWSDEGELYNNGGAFKITARSLDGVMVTILADNYYGYCKKEVKTQISFSANLFGLAEEEHAGGALAFATVSLGDDFLPIRGRARTASPKQWSSSVTRSRFSLRVTPRTTSTRACTTSPSTPSSISSARTSSGCCATRSST